jgi:epoxide hydrolase 4
MIEHGYAEVNGLRLHYVKDGKGRPVIFQHGFGHTWRQWEKQLAALAGKHQVVAVDMPGFGDSDKPAEVEKYKMRNLTACITGLADHLGYDKFTLVAHNLNGFGWIYAAFYPDRLDKLVIINAPHPNVMDREWRNNPEQAKASFYVPSIQAPGGEKFLCKDNFAVIRQFMGLDGLRDNGTITGAEYTRMLADSAREGTLTGWCNYYRATPTRGLDKQGDMGKRLQPIMINVPTLVIWGMKDHALLPGLLNGLDEFVPGVIIKRVEDGTHQLVLEEPGLVTTGIKEFLGS